MQKIKNNRGVTLVALSITVIVVIMLTTITANIGLDSINSTKDRKLQAELQMISQVVATEFSKAIELNTIDVNSSDTVPKPDNFIGTEISASDLPSISSGVTWKLGSEASGYKAYFRLEPTDLEKLGVKNAEDSYIVNYYTAEVYNVTRKVSSKGAPLYVRINTFDTYDEKPQDTTSFTT